MSCKPKRGVIIKKAPPADTIQIPEEKLRMFEASQTIGVHGTTFIQRRLSGNFAKRGFYLNNYYDWQIVKDNQGSLVLVPTYKG